MQKITSEVEAMYGFYWVTITFEGDDNWTLGRAFQSRKLAESSADKWVKKWNARLGH